MRYFFPQAAFRWARGAWLPALSLLGGLASGAVTTPQWIWNATARDGAARVVLSKSFELGPDVTTAGLSVIGDFAAVTVALNGKPAGNPTEPGRLVRFDVKRLLRSGANELQVAVAGRPGPSAVALRLEIQRPDGTRQTIVSDVSWRANAGDRVMSFGDLDDYPWGGQLRDSNITLLDDYEQWRLAQGGVPSTAVSAFQLPPGFELQLIRSAAAGEDSWISVARDPRGRIIVAREKAGLLRLTLDAGRGSVERVEVINEDLPEIRGLAFVGDDLFVNSNNHNRKPRSGEAGLFRLRDLDGNGRYEDVKRVGPATDTGGHGRNDITVGPDGWIYQMHGDSVSVPAGARVLPPTGRDLNPGDDKPHGHLFRTDVAGKRWEVVTHGLRNPFGVAFNPEGEAFTYDADAEHDMGSPWYRPTHVRHLVPGADYGWRRVTGMWPPYYPDHADEPPVTVVIGKGSPTAVEFGTRSHFPPAYRRALYALDWAYGRILAVHLAPQGAGYTGRAETFLRGTPANVTDLAFGADGAMYFTTGGRGTQSGLYRVRYAGPKTEPATTAQAKAREEWSAKARATRRELETCLTRTDAGARELAWRQLDHADPWIRHLARVVLERQPVAGWRERALNAAEVGRAVPSLLALASQGQTGFVAPVLERLAEFSFATLNTGLKLELLRTVSLCRDRLPKPDAPLPAVLVRQLEAAYPDADATVNGELAVLLNGMDSPVAVTRTLALVDAASGQAERMHYLHALRAVRAGWTPETRRRYFVELARMDGYRGGAGMGKFVNQIRADALANVPAAERAAMQAIFQQPPGPARVETPPRSFVKRWTMADAGALTAPAKERRDFVNGRAMFTAAMCDRCHQAGIHGRAFGPDLTSVSARFSRRDLLGAIIEPSRVIAEVYRNVTVTTRAGESHTGQLLTEGDYRSRDLRLVSNPLEPFAVTTIKKPDIVSARESTVSPMPEGLLDSLTREDILDLLAFLEAGGNPGHPLFQR